MLFCQLSSWYRGLFLFVKRFLSVASNLAHFESFLGRRKHAGCLLVSIEEFHEYEQFKMSTLAAGSRDDYQLSFFYPTTLSSKKNILITSPIHSCY